MNLVFVNGWSALPNYWSCLNELNDVFDRIDCVHLDDACEQADVLTHIESKIDGPTLLAGWSLGGMLAVRAAVLSNTSVCGVCALQSNASFVARDHWEGMPAELFDEFSSRVASESVESVYKLFGHMMLKGDRHKRSGLKKLNELNGQGGVYQKHVLTKTLSLLGDIDLNKVLPDLKVPALFLFGENDSLVPARVADRLESANSRITTAVLPEVAHAPMLSAWPAIKQKLRSFAEDCACPLV